MISDQYVDAANLASELERGPIAREMVIGPEDDQGETLQSELEESLTLIKL